MVKFNWRRAGILGALALITTSISAPALANKKSILIASRPTRKPLVVRGFIRGTVELHNLVGDRDKANRRCMGYGGAAPDHILDISKGVSRLDLQVRSSAKDTTLVIKGPNQTLFCADDSKFGKDAGISLSNLSSGRYQVWVGSFDSGKNFSYRLSLR